MRRQEDELRNRVLEGLASGLDELCAEYEAALRAIHRLVRELQGLRDGLQPSAAQAGPREAAAARPPADAPLPPRMAEIEVRESGVSEVLALQEVLANVPGISRVTLTGTSEGRVRILVELTQDIASQPAADRPAPTLVCAFCSHVISEGGVELSHGLCAECAGPFLRGAQGTR